MLAVGAALLTVALFAAAAFAVDSTSFKMVRSQAAVAGDCLKGANAHVDIATVGYGLQNMDVTVNNAPKNTELELFVTQQANSPLASPGTRQTSRPNGGHGEVHARGIFGEELFVFAPGSVKAPQVDKFDAKKNPAFKPVHTSHLGLWFGSPQEAKDAGCPDTSRSSMVTTRRASRRLAPATSPPGKDP